MDLIGESRCGRIAVMKSKRVGFTKGCIVAPLGHRIHLDPCSAIVCLPTDEEASTFSKTEITPLFEETPELAGLFSANRGFSKEINSSIKEKHYAGGTLFVGPATSARLFRGKSASLAFADEVDAYVPSAGGGGGEGDQIKLLEGRLADAINGLLVVGSTPKIKNSSKIAREFDLSDQRRFFVPCPHCDHGQFLQWGGRDHDYGIKWPDGKPAEAFYLCEHCHCEIGPASRARMIDEGRYQAQNGAGLFPGFHIWAAYSPLPSASWGNIAREFLEVKDNPLTLQVWVNTVLGEPFEEIGESPSDEKLMQCREAYALRETGRFTSGGTAETAELVPKGVAVLTSAVDVQKDRLEHQVWGWGPGEEAWTLEHNVYWGDPTADPIWEVLWRAMLAPRYMERGGVDYIRATSVDSGYASQSVYKFVQPRPVYRTPDRSPAFAFAIKGTAGAGQVWPSRPSKSSFEKVPVYPVRVDPSKEWIYARAKARILSMDAGAASGPGVLHWPYSLDAPFFHQFTAEQRMIKVNTKGFQVATWELRPGRVRNEAFDCSVYNYVTLCALYSMGLDLSVEHDRVKGLVTHAPEHPEVMPAVVQAPVPTSQQLTRSPRRKSLRDIANNSKKGGW